MLFELCMIGAAMLGGAAIVRFWDEIKAWLNRVAADAVERVFGYQARQNIHKAVAIVDRIVNRIKNTSHIYSKKSPTSTYYDKTTIIAEGRVEDLEADVRKELARNNNRLTQEFNYM